MGKNDGGRVLSQKPTDLWGGLGLGVLAGCEQLRKERCGTSSETDQKYLQLPRHNWRRGPHA
jgi:hypothetical protein